MEPSNREVVFRVRIVHGMRAKLSALSRWLGLAPDACPVAPASFCFGLIRRCPGNSLPWPRWHPDVCPLQCPPAVSRRLFL